MNERMQAVLARIGQLSLQGQLPSERGGLLQVLVAEGFAEPDVLAALDEIGPRPAAPKPEALAAPVVQLSQEAGRFLSALRDLGYLDDDLEADVLDSLMAEAEGNVGLDALRRHVAMVLFDRQYELDAETLRLLEEEWRLAFH
jgi:hypothetical protein